MVCSGESVIERTRVAAVSFVRNPNWVIACNHSPFSEKKLLLRLWM